MRKLTLLTAGVFILFAVGTLILSSGGDSDFDEVSLAEQQLGISLESRRVDAGGLQLHVVFAGPQDAEPVILIHGFPQFWYMWREHIGILAKAGYRVAAVDLRGYNRSDKPSGRAAYSYREYARDIIGLMDAEGWNQANIISHDIGAVVTWQLIFNNAERLSRAVIFSGAHPLAFSNAEEQSEVSWYRTFFRLPILPELVMRLGGMSLTAKNLVATSRPGTFTDAELEIYQAAWDREHAIDSMLGAYRNDGLDLRSMPDDGRPDMPVLFINGLEDKFVPASVAEDTRNYLGSDNVVLYPGLSHWILEEEPELTALEMIEFLQRPISR
ncbi:MAG: alpha/beta hydrolase [Gammaproteobacteria bacterium]|nr:alpha/beta hydrolase [Gammaproteobacteria bacterium]